MQVYIHLQSNEEKIIYFTQLKLIFNMTSYIVNAFNSVMYINILDRTLYSRNVRSKFSHYVSIYRLMNKYKRVYVI